MKLGTEWALLILLREPELLKNMPEEFSVNGSSQGPVTLKEPPEMHVNSPCVYIPATILRQFNTGFVDGGQTKSAL